MKIFILITAVLLICGCAETVTEKEIREYTQWKEKQQIEACTKAGGIPIYSFWSGLMECKLSKDLKSDKAENFSDKHEPPKEFKLVP